ncbi:efflux RND transporter periplasmic adaptor subunit [Thiocystis violacea]|uniref:efflux RND transporter periplasmic adaptor subunit n=1 Tax=Thiocystis violacea TaxID=13725 RepID=UPI0030B86F34
MAEVAEAGGGEEITLSGTIEAEDSINLAFRVGGQLIQRSVNVGDRVRAGQTVARLDPETARNAADAARANVAAAMARLVETRATIARYEPMVARGFVARQQFDRAVESRNAAEAQVEAAEAKLRSAENQLSFTELVADAAGTVTARGAEPGEVVAAGQMVVQLAREGGRDAVFDFPSRVKDALAADTVIEVVSTTDPKVRAVGRVREVSPQADPVTRTFRVRVGLANPPEALRLGSSVSGKVPVGGDAEGLSIPAAALTRADGQPAVWVVDPDTQRVALRSIDVIAYELDRVLVQHGLMPGDLVVTAGVQSLRPDQPVRLFGAAPAVGGAGGTPAEPPAAPDEAAPEGAGETTGGTPR